MARHTSRTICGVVVATTLVIAPGALPAGAPAHTAYAATASASATATPTTDAARTSRTSQAVAPAATPTAPQAVTLKLNTLGSKDVDAERTQQYLVFENADWTGLYIRPGIEASFKVTVESADNDPNIVTAYRQAGHADKNDPTVVQAREGTVLHKGENTVKLDTRDNDVGQLLLIRNDGGKEATVTIESLNAPNGTPSLGSYPTYTYDPANPQGFWTYVQKLRQYVKDGVASDTNTQVHDPSLGMNVTSLTFGRMVYDLRASKMERSILSIPNAYQAGLWATKAYTISTDRLDFFDHLTGFDKDDPDARQKSSQMKVVLELTDNLTNPSMMFAWNTMYHMSDGGDYGTSWPRLVTDVDAAHMWGSDHEYGHMLDIKPLAIPEETNNFFAMYGRRESSLIAKKTYGAAFSTTTYHTDVLAAQKKMDEYLNQVLVAKAAGTAAPASPWGAGNVDFNLIGRFNALHWFDDYDYADYNFANASGYTQAMADQVKKYGALGAVYRQVRRDAAGYSKYNQVNASARAYSDALGFDMSDVMERFGMPVASDTKAYTAKYPKLDMKGVKVQYFSLDADARGINGAKPFAADAKAPTVTATAGTNGALTVKASYAAGTAEAATASGYELRADGEAVGWSPAGTFTLTPKAGVAYTVVAFDARAYPSPAAPVPGLEVMRKVTFDTDGGSAVEAQEVKDGGKVTEPAAAPTKAGFTFAGWYTGANGTGDKWDFSADTVTRDLTLYAKWVPAAPQEYEVTFKYNDGTTADKVEKVTTGSTVARPTVPTRTGYTFMGWYTTPGFDAGTEYTFTEQVTGAVTLYAKWEQNPPAVFTVTFETDGGSEVKPQQVTDGGLAKEPDPTPTREGFELEGWFTAAGKKWNFATDTVTGSVTLTAHWKATQVSVTFAYNYDGAPADAVEWVTYGTAVARPATDPVREGYTFRGWFTAAQGGVAYDFKATVTAPLTLYAQWEKKTEPAPVKHTVTFDATGGSAVASQQVEDGAFAAMPNPAPTRTGFDFAGWYTRPNGAGEKWDFATHAVHADITLYAAWTAQTPAPQPEGKTWKVTFAYGVDGMADTTVEVKDGQPLAKPADPTRSGWTFTGWYTTRAADGSVSGAYDFSKSVDASMTLYAGWKRADAGGSQGSQGGSTGDAGNAGFEQPKQPAQAPAAGAKPSSRSGTLPKTGDDAGLVLPAAFAGMGAAILGAVARLRRRA